MYAVMNKRVARARLQSKIGPDRELVSEKYDKVVSQIKPIDNVLSFAKEGPNQSGSVGYCYFDANPCVILKKISCKELPIYEIIPPNVPIKLFFDIDGAIADGFLEAVEDALEPVVQ